MTLTTITLFFAKVWSWIKEHWKLTLTALSAAAIFVIGFMKGSKGKRIAQAQRDLAKKDSEEYKKNNEDFKEGVEALTEDYTRKRDKIEDDKAEALTQAKKDAKEKKKELENDPEKLDKILKEKFDLEGR
mgnify:CR=1 FL=1